ncbi:MAG: UDP-2,3-diacylglucosamine diphosphatase LpxI [Sedimentisphaerales bacterium]|nr:UDP-2,3-diacylglucosamine diphosphatase LpxI [Sedimentisphaerales bacterium]
MDKQVLGLIAGEGRLPFLVAEGARAAGLSVVCAGLMDNAEPDLAKHVDVFGYCPIARPGAWIRLLRRHNVTHTIMVGRVAKTRIYTPWRILRYLPDWRAFRIWYWRLRGRDKRNDSILRAIAEELASGGIILQDSTQYCRDHLAEEGVMTRTQPGPFVQADIEFGWQIVKKLGELDIGQAVAVKEREVIAVEAIEGTAKMIERTGELCPKGGWTLIKVAKPNQDLRFDVPCVGPDTIESMARYGAGCLVLEKGRTIILDKPQTIELADKHKIAVVGH